VSAGTASSAGSSGRLWVRIPELLAHNAVARCGDEGRRWLAELPALVDECARRWAIVVEDPFEPGGVSSWVAPAVGQAGAQWVLKLSLPDEESRHTPVALRLIHGEGAVRLIDVWRDRRALLLERLVPGVPLTSVEDEDEAGRIAAALLRRIWRPLLAGHPFTRAAAEADRWAVGLPRDFDAYGRPPHRPLITEAVELAYHLVATEGELVLAARDCDTGNILSGEREPWLALDLRPIAAEREYGCGALLRDRRAELAGDPAAARRMSRRLDLFSHELGLDRERLRGWGLLQAVVLGLRSLSAGDTREGELQLGCAQLLSDA
jgi:streptomycin 6-kinase